MSLFAIGDLHLPLGIEKPMDVFGSKWENYVERIYTNWMNSISDDDTILLCGDLSWATYLEQAKKDFDFINNLPGRKIVIKGNHDYWWTTTNKLNKFVDEQGYNNIHFLQNNSYLYDDFAICGTRGWKSPFDKDFNKDDKAIYERELIRLRLSLEDGLTKSKKLIVIMHYPPDYGFYDLFEEFDVIHCFFAHLHGENAWKNAVTSQRDILVSSDYLGFVPYKII